MPAEDIAAAAARGSVRAVKWLGMKARGQVVVMVGGPARARVIVLFGAVLALNSADTATIGAAAPQLEAALHIGNAKIGLLSSVALLVGAIFVLPVGFLVDRFKRVPMLAISIVLWSVASLLSGISGSYGELLLTRLALGAVTATAGPAIASLTGDYFPAAERGRVYAYILGGEIAGTAAGFIVSGTVASLISWRVAFVLLSVPGFFLARTVWRTVPEPLRGGQSRLRPGAVGFEQAPSAAAGAGESEGEAEPAADADLAYDAVRKRGVEPDPKLVLTEDPRQMRMVPAIRYIMSIPTNVLMIIGSSLGYFFFAGLQTFAVVFMKSHYHVSQATAELVLVLLVGGAMIGTLVSGRLTDTLLHRGFLEARVWVPALCYLGATALLIPGIIGSSLTPALWFDIGGAALLSAANPPLDAARLDIMPAGLWGRAESTRTLLRSGAQALAPLLFGGVADLVAGFVPEQAPVGTHAGGVHPGTGTGLEVSFLIMLSSLAAAGVFLARSRKTYPRDVATAAASHQGTTAPVVSRAAPAEPAHGSGADQ